jgi:hypothetical protein
MACHYSLVSQRDIALQVSGNAFVADNTIGWHCHIAGQQQPSFSPLRPLFRIPHPPPAVLCICGMRQCVREGSDARSETKFNNLETNKYGSNPPFQKNIPPFPFCNQLSGGNNYSFLN